MSHKTRRQHYVWRKYLEPWTTKGKIWCRRESKIFSADLMNVAQERDFYTPERTRPANDVVDSDAGSGGPAIREQVVDATRRMRLNA